MNRRGFLTATAAATCLAGSTAHGAETGEADPEYYEWRTYRLGEPPKQQLLKSYLQQAALPAWKRMGIGPVGVFTETGETATAAVHVLLPYRTLQQFAGMRQAVENDSQYLSKAQEYLASPANDPAFDRIESSLMVAFTGMPRMEVPTWEERVFEMRVYESHSEAKARQQIKMLNNGEIEIFRDLGFQPTFFGETLIGSRLPNLRYMLAAENLEALAAGWEGFHEHPDWLAMKDLPQYADTVSHITKAYLLPTDFSEI